MKTANEEFIAALKDASVVAPELPQADAFETLEALEFYERQILFGLNRSGQTITTLDYHEGSATRPDEVEEYGSPASDLLTSADHATSPYSKKKKQYRSADHGTGGLARLLAERDNVQSIIPLGKQTYDVAASSDDHEIKESIRRLLPGKDGFMSLHGMYSGKLTDIHDKQEIHALIGLGLHENEPSRAAVEQIVRRGTDLGLRVAIGNDTVYRIYDPATGGYKLTAEGTAKTGQLMARKEEMTTNFAHRLMTETGQQIPAFQLELARLLLQVPADIEDGWHVDRKSRAIGVYLGYLLAKTAIEVVRDLPQTPETEVW